MSILFKVSKKWLWFVITLQPKLKNDSKAGRRSRGASEEFPLFLLCVPAGLREGNTAWV